MPVARISALYPAFPPECRTCTSALIPVTQRDFETRLWQQLGEMDISIRRNFEKLLGQHQVVIEAAIGRAHDDAQEQLVDGLLDITVSMRRLEAKLDRIAECVLQRQNSSVAGDTVQDAPQQKPFGSESRKQRHCSNTSVDSKDAQCDVGAVRSTSFLAIIDKVCAGKGLEGNLVSGQLMQQVPVSNQLSRVARPDACFPPELQREVQLSEQQTPAQAAQQQQTTELSEQQVENELSVPHRTVELSFRRKQGREINLLHEGFVVHNQSRKELMGTQELITMKPMLEFDRKLEGLSESIGKKLERIAYALGIRNLNVVDNSADDAEDRKRLIEKLKSAFESSRQKKFSDKEKWLDYLFGICKPDQRIGKRGSR
jgi:hypothetical protein